MPTRWITMVVVGLLALAWGEAGAHKLPTFPQVRLLSVQAGRDDPLVRRLTVEVRDPGGKQPVPGAKVTARALHGTLGSGLRVEPVPLSASTELGTYQGEIRLPRAGRWEFTVEVVGRHVGDAHFELDVQAPLLADGARRRGRPDLSFDFLTVRHLAMEWGHLAGFALWLVATGVGLLDQVGRRAFVLVGTWVAFAIEGVTGLYKMEYSTPFAKPLRLFALGEVPSVFFAVDYVLTLVGKHALMVMAMMVTLALTLHAWRSKPGSGVWMWRALLGVNALLALAIGGAVAVLGFYHAIVLHFS